LNACTAAFKLPAAKVEALFADCAAAAEVDCVGAEPASEPASTNIISKLQ
jgi:hypothetical protein